MGERGNIHVIQEGVGKRAKGVWFYTHWMGHRTSVVVRDALAKEWRWTDGNYLARIIFDQLADGEHGTETGFGIGLSACHSNYPNVIVNVPKQTVQVVGDSRVWTFAEFAAMARRDAERLVNPSAD